MSASPLAAAPALAERDFAPGLESAFARAPQERADRPCALEGRLPGWLRGRYYLNGPARFERGGQRHGHWLDGDGMVVALGFGGSGVRVTARYVRSAKWRAEEQAGGALFRAFGTAFPGDRLVHGVALASPVNVSVLPFAGRLLALGEQGLPCELDPDTLETRGEFTFGGALNALSPFAAHAKIDLATGELWNFGVSYASAGPCLHVYRFAPDGRLLRRRRVPLPASVSLHDFALAPRHALFHLGPYLLDMRALAQGGRPPVEALRFEPERGAQLLVVERESGTTTATVPLGAGYSLHTVNAFEDPAAGTLTLDFIELDRPVYDQYRPLPALFRDVSAGRPVRLVLDLRDARVARRSTIAYELAPDFAAIDPRRRGLTCDELWMLGISATGRAGRKFFDQLVHARWSAPDALDVWQAPAGQYLAGEPVYVGAPDGDGRGVVLCPLYDAPRDASALAVFDAGEVAAGPRALARFDAPVQLGFHAVFEPTE